MIDKFFTAEHVATEEKNVHRIKHKKREAGHTELWFLARVPEAHADFAELIWQTLETAYFETLTDENPYDRFEEALKIVNAQIMGESLIHDEDFLQHHSFLLALFSGGGLHLSVLGSAEVYLIRKGRLNIISEGLAPKEIKQGDVFANIASGEIESGDTVLLSTERLLRHATSSQLTDMLSSGVLEGMEALKELLHLSDAATSFALIHTHAAVEKSPEVTNVSEKTKGFGFSLPSGTPERLGKIWNQVEDWWQKIRAGNQKYFLGLVLGFLGLIVIIVFFNLLSGRTDQATLDSNKELLTQVRTELGNVESAATIGDNERATATLAKIDQDLQQVLKSGLFRNEALGLLGEATKMRDTIHHITRISMPQELVDTGKQKPNVLLKGIFPFSDDRFAYDDSTLFRIVLNDVANTFNFPTGVKMQEGVPLSAKNLLVFMDEKNKIYEYDPDTKKLLAAKTEDTNWKKGIDLASYGRFLYFLAPQDNQIWKYERKADNYGATTGYLKTPQDLSRAISFTIDGSIYVWTSDSKLLKFHAGDVAPYTLKNVPEEGLSGVTQVYTNEDLKYLLFFNPTKATIYVFSKTDTQAVYESQIILENVGKLQSISAKAPKTLLVTDERKVYEIPF